MCIKLTLDIKNLRRIKAVDIIADKNELTKTT